LYINIHSHGTPEMDEKAILNLHNNFSRVVQAGYYSIGLHPWYIDTNTRNNQLASLKEWCLHPQVLAIGECGLDKVCTTNLLLQQEVFIEQMQVAHEIRKPLIIHCVQAYEELLYLLDKYRVKVPVVFHGFSKQSLPLAQKIIAKGHYLSFGKALRQEKMRVLLRALPQEKIFLETDDAVLPIKRVYEWAAAAFTISAESLSLQLQKNAALVFGPTFQ
jgi:TatD DNase family protein